MPSRCWEAPGNTCPNPESILTNEVRRRSKRRRKRLIPQGWGYAVPKGTQNGCQTVGQEQIQGGDPPPLPGEVVRAATTKRESPSSASLVASPTLQILLLHPTGWLLVILWEQPI